MHVDRFLRTRPKQLGMQVVALLLGWFHFFYGNAVGVGVRVLPDSGHLPGDLHSRLVGLDGGIARREPAGRS